MTEQEAMDWLNAQPWYDEAVGARLEAFVVLVLEEADRQNLISSGTRDKIWGRHIVDSAQLLTLIVEDRGGLWVDLGTGAGFPGIVIACVRPAPIQLIEMRPLRASFLERCVESLELGHAQVSTNKVERVAPPTAAGIISARAYAPLDRLLPSAHHLGDEETIWLLPKGRQAASEIETVRRNWQGVFHVEQSITDPESAIVTVSKLSRKYAERPPVHRVHQTSTARWRGK